MLNISHIWVKQLHMRYNFIALLVSWTKVNRDIIHVEFLANQQPLLTHCIYTCANTAGPYFARMYSRDRKTSIEGQLVNISCCPCTLILYKTSFSILLSQQCRSDGGMSADLKSKYHVHTIRSDFLWGATQSARGLRLVIWENYWLWFTSCLLLVTTPCCRYWSISTGTYPDRKKCSILLFYSTKWHNDSCSGGTKCQM